MGIRNYVICRRLDDRTSLVWLLSPVPAALQRLPEWCRLNLVTMATSASFSTCLFDSLFRLYHLHRLILPFRLLHGCRRQSKASFTFSEGPAWSSAQLKGNYHLLCVFILNPPRIQCRKGDKSFNQSFFILGAQVTSPSTNKSLQMPDLAEESKSQSVCSCCCYFIYPLVPSLYCLHVLTSIFLIAYRLDSFTCSPTSGSWVQLERQVRPCWSHSGRFLTLHKRRKKRPPTRAMTSDQALLDDLYHGPTHVCYLSDFRLIFKPLFIHWWSVLNIDASHPSLACLLFIYFLFFF